MICLSIISYDSRRSPMNLRILLLILLTPFLLADARDFHVSPRGDDRNAGNAQAPFLTIQRARDAARALRGTIPDLKDTLFIYLHGGDYPLSAPLAFGSGDGGTASSPTVYAAYRGEHPVVTGGVRVRGWREETLDGKRVWTAPDPRAEHSGQLMVHELWINNERRPQARIPGAGYLSVLAIPERTPSTEWLDGQKSFVARREDLPASLDTTGAEVVVMTRWIESRLPLCSFDPATYLLSCSRRSVIAIDSGDAYYVVNSRSGLNRPGQWWYDRTGRRIVYLPQAGERMDRIVAYVPSLTQLVRVTGDSLHDVRRLIFRGITFRHAEWYIGPDFLSDSRNTDSGGFVQAATGVPAAVEFTFARDCAMEDCEVSHCGTYALELGRGCVRNSISRCTFSDLGAGGVKIGMKTIARDMAEATRENEVLDCEIGNGGKLFHSAVGVWVAQSPRNRFIHNEIHDFYYSGFSIGWTWGYGPADAAGTLVELNHVHHIGRLANGDGPILSDMGGIYTLGNQRGSVIRRNVFHDVAARIYGGWGIYFDEGTTAIIAEDNLVYRTTHGGFHQHYGKENIVRNNIFAFGEEQQIQRTRAENHTSFAFERNIILWPGHRLFKGPLREGDMVFDRNCYWPMGGTFRADTMSWTQWQDAGFDRHSIVADPAFTNPAADDYSIRAGSPVRGLGFVPVDFRPVFNRRPVESAGSGSSFPPGRRPLLYNNDGSNILMAYDSLTPKRAYERIDAIAGSGVTTFLHNVNPGQNMGYPTSVAAMYHWSGPSPGDTSAWSPLGRRMSENLARMVRDSIDPVGLVMNRARLRGMGAFLTFRMNELHDVDRPESPLLSPFWKSHPEYRVGGYEGWGKEALNYAVPEVREHFFSLLREVVSRYDLEGLELDFMRFPYYFPLIPDPMIAHAGEMTAFVGRVRRLVDSVSSARGMKILLAARVPSSLKGCAHAGLDPAAWSRERLIDFLTVAPFLSTETDIPIAEFKAACGSVPVYAGIEFTIGNRQMTREEKRAACALLYGAGADGIYLFNYFVAWDAGLRADIDVLREIADPDSLGGKDKLYTLAVPRYPIPGVSLPGVLPLGLVPGVERTLSVRTQEATAPRSLILRIETEEAIESGDIALRVNGAIPPPGKTPAAPQIFPEKIWPELPFVKKTLEFALDPSFLRPEITLALTARRRLTVQWVYLGVLH
jgi:hypothetical protein